MSTLEAVTVPRLYRVIADQIAQKIRLGEFKVGGRLPSERELAEQLQVSRASVREALIALELEGYVTVRVGTGVFVLRDQGVDLARLTSHTEGLSSPSDIGPFDALETRLLLEPSSAALAAQVASKEHVQAIEQAHRLMATSDKPSQADYQFHIAIANACGNAALAAVIQHVWQLALGSAVYSQLDKHLVDAQVWRVAEQEHAVILEAIAAGDSAGAHAAMSAHLSGILDRLRVDFAQV